MASVTSPQSSSSSSTSALGAVALSIEEEDAPFHSEVLAAREKLKKAQQSQEKLMPILRRQWIGVLVEWMKSPHDSVVRGKALTLARQGCPPALRGIMWIRGIGNTLEVTQTLYETSLARSEISRESHEKQLRLQLDKEMRKQRRKLEKQEERKKRKKERNRLSQQSDSIGGGGRGGNGNTKEAPKGQHQEKEDEEETNSEEEEEEEEGEEDAGYEDELEDHPHDENDEVEDDNGMIILHTMKGFEVDPKFVTDGPLPLVNSEEHVEAGKLILGALRKRTIQKKLLIEKQAREVHDVIPAITAMKLQKKQKQGSSATTTADGSVYSSSSATNSKMKPTTGGSSNINVELKGNEHPTPSFSDDDDDEEKHEEVNEFMDVSSPLLSLKNKSNRNNISNQDSGGGDTSDVDDAEGYISDTTNNPPSVVYLNLLVEASPFLSEFAEKDLSEELPTGSRARIELRESARKRALFKPKVTTAGTDDVMKSSALARNGNVNVTAARSPRFDQKRSNSNNTVVTSAASTAEIGAKNDVSSSSTAPSASTDTSSTPDASSASSSLSSSSSSSSSSSATGNSVTSSGGLFSFLGTALWWSKQPAKSKSGDAEKNGEGNTKSSIFSDDSNMTSVEPSMSLSSSTNTSAFSAGRLHNSSGSSSSSSNTSSRAKPKLQASTSFFLPKASLSPSSMDIMPVFRGNEASAFALEADLGRTFPAYQAFFAPGSYPRAQLQRVLSAYAFFRPDHGYIQGMSHVAVILILTVGSLVPTPDDDNQGMLQRTSKLQKLTAAQEAEMFSWQSSAFSRSKLADKEESAAELIAEKAAAAAASAASGGHINSTGVLITTDGESVNDDDNTAATASTTTTTSSSSSSSSSSWLTFFGGGSGSTSTASSSSTATISAASSSSASKEEERMNTIVTATAPETPEVFVPSGEGKSKKKYSSSSSSSSSLSSNPTEEESQAIALPHTPSEVLVFTCFSNIMGRAPLRWIASRDIAKMDSWYELYSSVLSKACPRVATLFEELGITPNLFLVSWLLTLFSKPLGLEASSRVWDICLVGGHTEVLRCAVGLTKYLEPRLLTLSHSFEKVMKTLASVPPELQNPFAVVEAAESVKLTSGDMAKLITIDQM